MILIFSDIFLDDERLYPSRTVRLLNNKASFGLNNEKLSKKLFVLEWQNCDAKVRNF